MAANFAPASGSNAIEGFIEAYDDDSVSFPVDGSFASEQNAVKREYGKWLDRMPQVSPEFGAGAELAAYVNATKETKYSKITMVFLNTIQARIPDGITPRFFNTAFQWRPRN